MFGGDDWEVLPSNGKHEAQILDTIAGANPERLDQGLRAISENEARPEQDDARLEIESTPKGADIEIDGAFVGMTPTRKTLRPGSYEVTIRKAPYRSWTRKVSVEAGDSVTIQADLESTFVFESEQALQSTSEKEKEDAERESKPRIKIIRN